jgi:PIN domain nuclease of toxin-antitoxin system
LEVPEPVVELIAEEGFEELVIKAVHAQEAAALPEHHKDPFDRMLVAQARLERLKLVTSDAAMQAYDVNILKV